MTHRNICALRAGPVQKQAPRERFADSTVTNTWTMLEPQSKEHPSSQHIRSGAAVANTCEELRGDMVAGCAMAPRPRGRPRGDDAGDRSKGDADMVGLSSASRCACATGNRQFSAALLRCMLSRQSRVQPRRNETHANLFKVQQHKNLSLGSSGQTLLAPSVGWAYYSEMPDTADCLAAIQTTDDEPCDWTLGCVCRSLRGITTYHSKPSGIHPSVGY